MSSSSSKIGSFIREISIIVIGVLIALFINNWNEQVKQDQFVSKTLYAVGQEIEQNKAEIEKTLARHYLTLDSLETNFNSDGKSLVDIIIELGGFQTPELKNIGLRFFISNSADLIDYQLISDLSEIEFLSKGFNTKVEQLIQHLYQEFESSSNSSTRKAHLLLSDVMESEESLLDLYDSFLEKYQSTLQTKEQKPS